MTRNWDGLKLWSVDVDQADNGGEAVIVRARTAEDAVKVAEDYLRRIGADPRKIAGSTFTATCLFFPEALYINQSVTDAIPVTIERETT